MDEFILVNGEVMSIESYLEVEEIEILPEEISKKIADMEDIADELSLSEIDIVIIEDDKQLAYYDSDWKLIIISKSGLLKNHLLTGDEYKEAKIFGRAFSDKSVLLSILLHELGHHYVQERFRFIYHIDNFFRTILFKAAKTWKNHKFFGRAYKWLPEEIAADAIATYLFYKHKSFLKKFEWLGV